MKQKLMLAATAAATLVAIGCAAGLVYTLRAVRKYEHRYGVSILLAKNENSMRKNLGGSENQKVSSRGVTHIVQEGEDLTSISIRFGVAAAEIRELNGLEEGQSLVPGNVIRIPNEAAEEEPEEKSAAPAKPPLKTLKVKKVKYEGESELQVFLSERPDMENARRYVEVSPLNDGAIGLRYRPRGGDSRIVVTGDFAFRTNVTLRIRKGLPVYGGAESDPRGSRSLSNDFTYVFQRRDLPPRVAFADKGRYLPPMGSRSVAVETVNASKIHAEVRRVEPRNVVQMLAREEDVYSGYSNRDWQEDAEGADKEDTGELAGEPLVREVECANLLNKAAKTPIPVTAGDGGPTNGIYLVTVRNGDRPRKGYSWYGDDRRTANPNRYRVVCLTDLGLSVRQSGEDTGVWVTSLKTGRPVQGCRVEAFSTANIKVAEGKTASDGWCVLGRVDRGKPFVVVAKTADDMSFLALRDSMEVDETDAEGARSHYLGADECTAFLWTERGIYRHDERMFLHGILRNGLRRAPKPFPVEVTLSSPDNAVFARRTLVPDANGAFCCDDFAVPADQPSGSWTFRAKTPGTFGKVLDWKCVKIEEFAPPQIRVKVAAPRDATPQTFSFGVSAEHLFGGPASMLRCEGAVVFEDVPFAPKGWEKFKFGNEDLGLKPSFRRLDRQTLDAAGKAEFAAPIWADSGLPKAAVRATGQGVVFEDGGRPATARASQTCHYYPFYIGATLPNWLKPSAAGFPQVAVACVAPDGRRLAEGRALKAKVERIDTIHAYREAEGGWHTWDSERVRTTVADGIAVEVSPDGDATLPIPVHDCGEYFLTISDPTSQASFGRSFYLGDGDGDDEVRTSLGDPTEVAIQPDKAFYRVGETPRLMVKAPFAGAALLSVMRDKTVFTQVLDLTNATSIVSLPAVAGGWAPSVDVALSVVQSVADNARHLAVRAHGQAVVAVRPVEDETPVKLDVAVETGAAGGGSTVTVDVDARGGAATGTVAVVTVVDEGINLLTDEPVPDPVAHFAAPRRAEHPLYDLYGKILPVLADDVRRSGVKTGGGYGAEMLGRVSPVPTRRFKPLALWSGEIPVSNGLARAVFRLPEFAGEVRVTAVAYSESAAGAASLRRKVSPKIVMQPDAPRFAAPGDRFDVTLPIHNRSGAPADVAYAVGDEKGSVRLAAGASTNVCLRLAAPDAPGQMAVMFRVDGCGESHEETLELPIRPAVPWRETAGTVRLEPGEKRTFSAPGAFARHSVTVAGSPVGELVAALEWLAAYPHGCLEQTSSRIFPLITAGGILNAVQSRAATNRASYVAAGVKRVQSMIRKNDCVMWPDCNYPPWDREVSLYAAHFLVEAEKAGQRLDPTAKAQVVKFLQRWAASTNAAVSAYACHTLALAGMPEKDRMFRLYDGAKSLSPLSRARLARAFALSGEPSRADALLAGVHSPGSVKEAAFAVLALLERNPSDGRLPQLVSYLAARRDPATFSWGTTESNAHALLAIGAFYRHHPPQAGKPKVRVAAEGVPARVLEARQSAKSECGAVSVENIARSEAFVAWRTQELPPAASVTNEACGISVSREFLTADGDSADMGRLSRGDLLMVRLSIRSDAKRTLSDLVVEDLFAGAFEPVHSEIAAGAGGKGRVDWVMRKDARDDRMLVFSKKFDMEAGNEVEIRYPVRVVSAGDFALPGPSVEGMYDPSLRARCAAGRVVVER